MGNDRDINFVTDRLRFNAKQPHFRGMVGSALLEAAEVIEGVLKERDSYRRVAIQGAKGFFVTKKRCEDYVDSQAQQEVKTNGK